MFTRPINFRTLLTVTTALGLAVPLAPARAQDASTASTASSSAPPPANVGEISSLNGAVSFNGAGSNGQWVAASINYPVSTSDSLFTQAGAQATVAVQSSRLTLAENTELQITGLDQNSLAATESQGEMFLAISYLQPGQNFAITTPRGTVTISQNGNYDIAVGDQTTPTVITVLDGAATVTDPGASLQVAAGQSGVLSGTDQTVAQLGTADRDAFITSMLAVNAPPPPSYAPPVVSQMTGVTALASYGSWSQSSSYGAVWYPSVGSDWAPYREGHWAYVQPWGYTWVDSEPWGFAPFHYGRWIDDGNRWGWVPAAAYSDYGPSYQPVYAPALVSFFGAGVGVGVGVGVGLSLGGFASGSIGWLPLAPNEAYYPSYGYGGNRSYFDRINYVNVRRTNIQNINNTTIVNNYNNYANRRGATYINAAQMGRGDAVGRYGKPVPQDMLAKAQPIGFRRGEGGPTGQHAEGLPQPNFERHAAPAPHPTAFADRHDLPHAVISHEPAPNLRPGQAYAGPNHPPGGQGGFGQGQQHPGQPQGPGAHPGFGANPGFKAPPAPPGGGTHIGFPAQPGQQHGQQQGQRPNDANAPHQGGFNAPNAPHQGGFNAPGAPREIGNNPGFHPPPAPPGEQHPGQPGGEAPHANLPNVVHPGEPLHPITPNAPRPENHATYPNGANHPENQPAFHPQQAPQVHPQAQQQFHPQQQQSHPQPQPQFHPQPQPQFHPQQPQPQARPQPQQQQFHPQQQQIQRPAEQPHPQPQQQQPRPEDQHQDKKKG